MSTPKILTKEEAERIIDKLWASEYPWKHELNYLQSTLDYLFEEKFILDGLRK
jgi:hypothetical protein